MATNFFLIAEVPELWYATTLQIQNVHIGEQQNFSYP